MSINDLRELSIMELENKILDLKKRINGLKICVSNESNRRHFSI